MHDPHDLDLEHQRRLRAERVLTMLRELWGDDLPPGPNAELAVLIDAIALDDNHGADDQLITQRDGLTYAMLAELITHYRPDTATPTAGDPEQVDGPITADPPQQPTDAVPALNTATPSDVAAPPPLAETPADVSTFNLPPKLEAMLSDLHLLHNATAAPTAPLTARTTPAVTTDPVEQTDALKIVKPAQVGMWELDPQSGDVAYDGVTAQLLGIGTEAGNSTITQHLSELIHPADRDRVDEAIKYALRTQTTYRVRFRVITALGSPTWLISQGRVLTKPSDRSARLTGYLALDPQPQRSGKELIDLR